MSETPRISFKITVPVPDVVAVWADLEELIGGRTIPRSKFMSTLVKHSASIARAHCKHRPQTPEEEDEFLSRHGIELTGKAREFYNVAIARNPRRSNENKAQEDQRHMNNQVIAALTDKGKELTPEAERSMEALLQSMNETPQALPGVPELTPAPAPASTPKLTMQEIIAKQQAVWNESAKLDKQANQEIHRKIKKVS